MSDRDPSVVDDGARHIANLTANHPDARTTMGGKGASLARMMAMGLPVPSGFVLLTTGLDQFLAENGISVSPGLTAAEAKTVRDRIMSASWPQALANPLLDALAKLSSTKVAVRSSAAMEDGASTSWAGQFETYLDTTEETLLQRIQCCWCSMFAPAAMAYGDRIGSRETSMAVVIQAMVPADAAGTLFSMEPLSGDRDKIIIEAVSGGGELLAQGAVRPDRYLISKASGVPLQQQRGHQSERADADPTALYLLDLDDIRQLTQFANRLEAEYGGPVDVEWCRHDGALYLLQCRPVTANHPSAHPASYWFSWGEACTVLTAEVWARIHLAHHGMASGADDGLAYSRQGQLAVYLHEKEHARAAAIGQIVIEQHDFLDRFLTNAEASRKAYAAFSEEIAKTSLDQLTGTALASLVSRYIHLQADLSGYTNFSQPEYLEPARLRLRAMVPTEEDFVAITTPFALNIMQLEELEALELSFSAGCDDDTLQHHANRHPWLFAFSFKYDAVIAFVHQRIDALRTLPAIERRQIIDKLHGDARRKQETCERALERLGVGAELVSLARVFRELAIDRLRTKWYESGSEYLFRPLFEEVSQRIGISVQELHLTYREQDFIAALERGQALSEERRKRRHQAYLLVLLEGRVLFYEGDDAIREFERHVPPPWSEHGTTIKGTPANTGRVRGRVRLIRDAGIEQLTRDLATFPEGGVLVTGMTQPTMMSLARKASAVITDEGGVTSHAAVIARELDIPCIVGTGCGTRVLMDGDLVDVDATHGTVTRIEDEQ